jgi:hypothetical protein
MNIYGRVYLGFGGEGYAYANTSSAQIPPQISSISSGTLTTTSATVMWTTDQASNSKVVYGTSVSYGSSTVNGTLVTSHTINLSGLSSATAYHYAVVSTNSLGYISTSSDQTFSTVSGACSGFTPTSLGANLMGWYKADVSGSLALSGSNVTGWADLSGNHYDLLNNGAASPVYNATGLNGKPAIIWTATSSQELSRNVGDVAWGGTNSYGIFAIAATTANSNGSGVPTSGFRIGAGSPSYVSVSITADGSVPKIGAEYQFSEEANHTITVNTSHRIGLNADGTNVTLYVDGVGNTPVASNHSIATNGYIAINASNPSGWDGPLSDLIFVNRNLTGTELTNMDCYLSSRQ